MTEERSKADSETGEKDGFMPRKLPAGLKEFRGFYLKSIEAPEEFWRTQASRIKWDRTFTGVVREDISEGHVEWFMDGVLNAFRNATMHPKTTERADIRRWVFRLLGGIPFTDKQRTRDASESIAALSPLRHIAGDRFILPPGLPNRSSAACLRPSGIETVPVDTLYG